MADNPGKDILFSARALEVALPDMAAKPVFGRAPLIPILNGIDLDITRGSVLGIVGGSGSGKSTLGRALLRLIEPTAGTILFDGRDITHLNEDALRPIRRRMQMIFQDPMSSLNPRRRVGAIIADPMQMHGFDGIDGRIDDALDHVGLPRGFRTRYPHE
ncbi:MAG: ATP-binding cassette domain-containing protein, partial [Hoeflea sp.]|nr:ATP-binding cassette domain-containing protein [Hoeflea sp.]